MKQSDHLSARLENLIQENIDQFLSTGEERLKRVKVEDIRCQNIHSRRIGGLCTIEYWDSNKELAKRVYWIKWVEDPEKFFFELSSVYGLLERAGLQANITRPYLFDLDSGVVCIGYFDGTSLLKHTLRRALFFYRPLPQQFVHLYYNLGRWLQQYHEAVATDETVEMADVLVSLDNALEEDNYFTEKKKKILMGHLNNIRNSTIGSLTLTLVRTHNDFTLRNILLSDRGFGIIDWDAMVHPELPDRASVWNELTYFLLNLQSMQRFRPLISSGRIRMLNQSFLRGYFEKNSLTRFDCFNELFYVFTLRSFLGIDSDRPLWKIYRPRLGGRYIRFLEKSLLRGSADITSR